MLIKSIKKKGVLLIIVTSVVRGLEEEVGRGGRERFDVFYLHFITTQNENIAKLIYISNFLSF